VAWVHDAFAHCKVIGATKTSQALLDTAGVIADEGIVVGTNSNDFLAIAAKGRIWNREQKVRTTY
jgi:catalase